MSCREEKEEKKKEKKKKTKARQRAQRNTIGMAEPYSPPRFDQDRLGKEEFRLRRRHFFPTIDARLLVEQAQRNIRAWAQRQTSCDLRDDSLVGDACCFFCSSMIINSFFLSLLLLLRRSSERWAIV